MAAERDTLAEFEAWWKLPKKPGWLQFPQAQKMAAKAAWDAATNAAEARFTDAQQANHEICTCEVLEYSGDRSQVTLLVTNGCPVHDVQTS